MAAIESNPMLVQWDRPVRYQIYRGKNFTHIFVRTVQEGVETMTEHTNSGIYSGVKFQWLEKANSSSLMLLGGAFVLIKDAQANEIAEDLRHAPKKGMEYETGLRISKNCADNRESLEVTFDINAASFVIHDRNQSRKPQIVNPRLTKSEAAFLGFDNRITQAIKVTQVLATRGIRTLNVEEILAYINFLCDAQEDFEDEVELSGLCRMKFLARSFMWFKRPDDSLDVVILLNKGKDQALGEGAFTRWTRGVFLSTAETVATGTLSTKRFTKKGIKYAPVTLDEIEKQIAFHRRFSKKPNFPECYAAASYAHKRCSSEYKYRLVMPEARCNLHEFLKTFDKKPLRVIRILNDILQALNTLHLQRIVHGDVKLNNCLVYGNGSTLKVKLHDFGTMASVTDTKALCMWGQTYPSPEQTALFEAADFVTEHESYGKERDFYAADVWAAGIIFYELLTGKAFPFTFFKEEGDGQIQLAQRAAKQQTLTKDEVLNLKEIGELRARKTVPEALFTLLSEMLDPNPKFRRKAASCIERMAVIAQQIHEKEALSRSQALTRALEGSKALSAGIAALPPQDVPSASARQDMPPASARNLPVAPPATSLMPDSSGKAMPPPSSSLSPPRSYSPVAPAGLGSSGAAGLGVDLLIDDAIAFSADAGSAPAAYRSSAGDLYPEDFSQDDNSSSGGVAAASSSVGAKRKRNAGEGSSQAPKHPRI